ncbi:hypothetical protein [Muricoccus aerilatus]|uniref:hypothetical protein n=1 Tax=Muricoccus aerilatus TaxID=452982 RepID=UPI0005C1FA6B|nr:hypothetical protein [Roseomonas aerilata]
MGKVPRVRTAAVGSGLMPWELDLASLERGLLPPMALHEDGVPAISLSAGMLPAQRIRKASPGATQPSAHPQPA